MVLMLDDRDGDDHGDNDDHDRDHDPEILKPCLHSFHTRRNGTRREYIVDTGR